MAQPQVSAKKQQELQQQYTSYKNNLQQLAERIGNVEQETEEHKYVIEKFLRALVLETLKPLPETRKCFRMINGVLVERTVKDVLPALQTNSDGLKKVLDELVKQYKRQQGEMEKWKGPCRPRTRYIEVFADATKMPSGRPGTRYIEVLAEATKMPGGRPGTRYIEVFAEAIKSGQDAKWPNKRDGQPHISYQASTFYSMFEAAAISVEGLSNGPS
ncbi:MAG: hypothetical protein Q9220_001250 [cf. Caloplaca sp. 1 TL-2023]